MSRTAGVARCRHELVWAVVAERRGRVIYAAGTNGAGFTFLRRPSRPNVCGQTRRAPIATGATRTEVCRSPLSRRMPLRFRPFSSAHVSHARLRCALTCVAVTFGAMTLEAQDPVGRWPQHSRERPLPKVVTPGPFVPSPPPAGAVVLFDGTSLNKWMQSDSSAAKWRVVDGAFEVVPRTGGLVTRDAFGDVRLHIEWRSPTPPVGKDQDRGNSGVFFGGGRYEVQVLDSYENVTYADGSAASIYGQFPPLVNASRPPGAWQSYDIEYHRPRFGPSGALLSPAKMTVSHNGIVVHTNAVLVGPTANGSRPPFEAHPDRLPISLQDHGHPVRFRNVWVVDLEPPR